MCCFCDVNSSVKQVKVYFHHSPCSGYWILSNLSSHLQKCHSDKPQKKGKQTVISLKIEPVFQMKTSDVVEDQICTQMFTQTIKMINVSMSSKEQIHIFFQDPKKKVNKTVKICHMKKDGNCLYAALAHQLFHDKINSDEHKIHTQQLRSEVIDFIKQNFDSFVHHLKGRIYERNITKEIPDINAECLSFLEEELALEGVGKNHWGGTESIVAISQIHKANIIINNQNATCNMVRKFNPSYLKALLIAFGSSNSKSQNRNHYDSVVNISDNFIKKLTKDLANSTIKSLEGMDENIDGNKQDETIVID